MARARNIKPGFFKNYDLADLGPQCQLLFAGLWCLADREGRLEDKPRFIKAEVFPYYDFDVNGGLTLLHESGFVKRYTVNGEPMIQVEGFKKHQSPHSTEKPSVLPGIEKADPANRCPATVTVSSPLNNVNPQNDLRGNPPDSLIPDSLIPDSLIQGEAPTHTRKRGADSSSTISVTGLAAEGVEKKVAADWLTLRKAKRLPLTQTAWDGVKEEAEKVGMSPAQAVLYAVKANWASFKAEWVQRDGAATAGALLRPGGQGLNKQEALEARNRAVAEQVIAELSHASH